MGDVSTDSSEAVGVSIRLASAADIPAMRWVESDAGESFRSIGMERIADDAPPSEDALGAFIRAGRAWWRSATRRWSAT